jgi:hypothetical protein
MGTEQGTDLKAHLGLVIRGDLYELRDVLELVNKTAKSSPTLEIIYKTVTADKLWIKVGEKGSE